MNTQELTGAGTHGPRESFDQGLLALSTRSVVINMNNKLYLYCLIIGRH